MFQLDIETTLKIFNIQYNIQLRTKLWVEGPLEGAKELLQWRKSWDRFCKVLRNSSGFGAKFPQSIRNLSSEWRISKWFSNIFVCQFQRIVDQCNLHWSETSHLLLWRTFMKFKGDHYTTNIALKYSLCFCYPHT